MVTFAGLFADGAVVAGSGAVAELEVDVAATRAVVLTQRPAAVA